MKRFTKRHSGLIGVMVLIAVALVFSYAYAALKTETNRVTYTDKQLFRSDVEFRDKIEYGSGVQSYTNPLIVTMAGTSVYSIDPAKGSLFWINDYLSTDGTRGASSGVSIILPAITKAIDRYTVKIVKMTMSSGVSAIYGGTTTVCLTTKPWAGTSGTTDSIWNVSTGTTRQSMTLTMPEVQEIDATGDWLEFMAVYDTSGGTWYQINRYIQ